MAKPQYGWQHQASRARWNQHLTATGPRPCRRCGRLVYPDRQAHLNPDRAPFDFGHPEPWQTTIEPEHQSCNRAAGAAKVSGRGVVEDWW